MNDEYIKNDTNNTELKLSTICFRLQENLYKYIKELQEKTGKNESEVIRSILYAAKNNQRIKMESAESLMQQRQLINEINAIGRNINQIVKNNNSGLYSTYDKNQLFALMNKILEMVINNSVTNQ